MSQEKTPSLGTEPKKEVSPELRREVSRRSLIREEFRNASFQAIKQFPGFAGSLGFLMKESSDSRDERLLRNAWQLVVNRSPKPDEAAFSAGKDLLKQAQNPDEKGDAFVDVIWALTQSVDFEQVQRAPTIWVRGVYRLALDREPDEAELKRACELFREATDLTSRGAVIEGLLSGLVRSSESVFRQPLGKR